MSWTKTLCKAPSSFVLDGMAGMCRDLGPDVLGSEERHARKLQTDFSFLRFSWQVLEEGGRAPPLHFQPCWPVLLMAEFILTKDPKWPYLSGPKLRDVTAMCEMRFESHTPTTGKVNFCTGTGRKAFFEFFSAWFWTPPGTYAFTAKKGKFICTGLFFPHGMAFLEKKGGTGAGIRFYFPCTSDAKSCFR